MTKARENSDYTGLQGDLALKSPVASPVFTGNVGIGVTPESTWHSTHTVLQLGDRGALIDDAGGITMMSNSYYDSGWKYLNTDLATNYESKSGTHKFQVAPSGTADAAISWNTAMSIDNAGIVTKPLQPSFKVNGSNVAVDASGFGVVPFNLDSGNDSFDNGNNYNTTNYRFVAPVAGKYFVAANVRMDSMSGTYFRLLITKNGSENTNNGVHSIIGSGKSTNYHTMNVSGILNCAANDYLEVKYMPNNDTDWDLSLSESGFSGFLIG
jgi:hypothetical protein